MATGQNYTPPTATLQMTCLHVYREWRVEGVYTNTIIIEKKLKFLLTDAQVKHIKSTTSTYNQSSYKTTEIA